MIHTITLNPALDKQYHVSELVPNTVLRASSIKLDYGGKGFNIARMLVVYEVECTALGFVGGHTGDVLSKGLTETGIQTDFVQIQGETRTNISAISDKNDGYIKINEPGPTVSADETQELLQKVKKLVQPEDWWVLAGSIPRGVPMDIYAQLIQLINQGGAKAVLDSSGEAFKIGCTAQPFLIKPNLDELIEIAEMNGSDIQKIRKAIEKMHQLGISNIILSAGKEQAICSDGRQQWIGIPPQIKEVNPIGAGDAMVASVVYRLSIHKPLLDAFQWGLAAGSAAANLAGTMMPTKADVESLLKKVSITEE